MAMGDHPPGRNRIEDAAAGKPVVSRILWKFSGGEPRACGGSAVPAVRSRDVGGFPFIDLSHQGLTGGEQCLDQHRHGSRAGLSGLGLDAASRHGLAI